MASHTTAFLIGWLCLGSLVNGSRMRHKIRALSQTKCKLKSVDLEKCKIPSVAQKCKKECEAHCSSVTAELCDETTIVGLCSDECAELLESANESGHSHAASKPEVVFVLGGPGSGKSTASKRLKSQFGYKTLSAGELIRAELERPGTKNAKLIEKRIKEGQLIPSEIVVSLIENEMLRQGWSGRYLIDGFPRSLDNYRAWKSDLAKKVDLKFTLFLERSDSKMETALLTRGETSGRSDDNVDTIRKRIATFKEETIQVLDALRDNGIAIETVNTEPGLSRVIEEVVAVFE